jgi:hypothetical protein
MAWDGYDACHAGTRGGWAVVGHQRTARGRVSAACDEIAAIDAVPLEQRSVKEQFFTGGIFIILGFRAAVKRCWLG